MVVVAAPEKDKLPPERVAEEMVRVPAEMSFAASESNPEAAPAEVMFQVLEVMETLLPFVPSATLP